MPFKVVATSLERFTTRYVVGEGGCWLWSGARKTKFGYGQMWVDGKSYSSHRLAYMLFRGDIPDGMCVCHHCDRPSCVNPDHLFLGTKAENNADRDRKGRYRNGRTKLSADQVREILESPEPSPATAKRFGVTRGRIEQIRRAAGQRRVRHY